MLSQRYCCSGANRSGSGISGAVAQCSWLSNRQQKRVLFDKVNRHFNGKLQGKVIALWGLSFKPDTDDMREAPSTVLMEALWEAGAKVQAFDPAANDQARRIYGTQEGLLLAESQNDALLGADALVVVTEWHTFRSPDLEQLKTMLKTPVIFDGRNIYDPELTRKTGFTYYGIGRN